MSPHAMGAIALLAAAWLIWTVAPALSTGEIAAKIVGRARRDHHPFIYWTNVTVAGACVVLLGFVGLTLLAQP